jgi:hypothetical protein
MFAVLLSCNNKNILTFLNKEGVELFQMDKDKIGSSTYDCKSQHVTVCVI